MKPRSDSVYIQPDARGRILLPKELREIKLLKLTQKEGCYELVPLAVQEMTLSNPRPGKWLTQETEVFLHERIFPKLAEHFEKHPVEGLVASFLYGSRARKDALSRSDFDFGLLFDKYPKAQTRHAVSDRLLEVLKTEFEVLKRHGVDAEASFHFFSSKLTPTEVPPIYLSVATDGRLIWQKNSSWNLFLATVESIKKTQQIHMVGQGKDRQWVWGKK
jgi:predicted nucleotidyltransferase